MSSVSPPRVGLVAYTVRACVAAAAPIASATETVEIAFGEAFGMERRVVGRWSEVVSIPRGAWTEILCDATPGTAFRWQFRLLKSAAPGLYRLKKVVESERHRRRAYGEFLVR